MIKQRIATHVIAALFGTLVIAGLPLETAYAASVESLLTHVDRNKDGMVSRDEFLKRAEEMFNKMDKTKKGMMTMDTAHTAVDKALENLLVHTPTNADGMVTKEAFMQHAAEMFDEMDKGKKGMMTMSAYKKFLEQLASRGG
jgi:Ca2+-binding EF-hand superfamily protein